MADTQEVVTVSAADAARLIGVSDKTIRAWVAADRLTAEKVQTPGEGPAAWQIEVEQLAQLAKLRGAKLNRERLIARIAQLDRELRALRRMLLALGESEGASGTASSYVDVAPPPPMAVAEAVSAPILAPSSTSADYHSQPVIPDSREVVQRRSERRQRERERERATSSDPMLPDGWVAAVEYVQSQAGKPQTTASRWIKGVDKYGRPARERKVPEPHHGRWRKGPPGSWLIRHAYDPQQQREAAAMLRGRGDLVETLAGLDQDNDD